VAYPEDRAPLLDVRGLTANCNGSQGVKCLAVSIAIQVFLNEIVVCLASLASARLSWRASMLDCLNAMAKLFKHNVVAKSQ
jgi:hypothetical protein